MITLLDLLDPPPLLVRELKNPPLLSVGFLYLLVPVCMGNMLTFLRVRVLVTVQLRCQKEVIGPGTKASRLRNAAPCGEANDCKVVRLSYSSTLQISKQRAGEADTVLGRTKAKSMLVGSAILLVLQPGVLQRFCRRRPLRGIYLHAGKRGGDGQ